MKSKKIKILLLIPMLLLFGVQTYHYIDGDDHKVRRWYKKSFINIQYHKYFAERGNLQEQLILIDIYGSLNYSQRGRDGFFKWATIAAKQQSPKAWFKLSGAYRFGHGTKKDLEKAKIWALKAGERGHIYSLYAFAQMTEETAKNANDYAQAYFYFQQAEYYGHLMRDEYYSLKKKMTPEQIKAAIATFNAWKSPQ